MAFRLLVEACCQSVNRGEECLLPTCLLASASFLGINERVCVGVCVQEYRSEKSLEELGKLVPPECHW